MTQLTQSDLTGFFHAITDLFPGARCLPRHDQGVDGPGLEAIIGDYRITYNTDGIILHHQGNRMRRGISPLAGDPFIVSDWTALRDGFLTHVRDQMLSDMRWTAQAMGITRASYDFAFPELPSVMTNPGRKFLGDTPGTIVLIAGGPGQGKTSVAMDLAVDATKDDRPVFFYSDQHSPMDMAYMVAKWGPEVVDRTMFLSDPKPPQASSDILAYLERILSIEEMTPSVIIIEAPTLQQALIGDAKLFLLAERVPKHQYVVTVQRRLKETTDEKARLEFLRSMPTSQADYTIWCDGPYHPYRVFRKGVDIGRYRIHVDRNVKA